MQLEMTHNGKFGQKSGLDWVKTAIFAYFSIFSPKMRLRLTRNGQFHLIHNFSHLLPPKHLIFGEISKIFISGGGTSANFLSFPTFSNRFTPMWLEMTHNGKFGQKSGLDWVKMAIFAYFSIFSPKMRLRLTRNGQFHLIHNFSHLLPPKHLIFGEISKIFISGGGGYIGKFFEFSNFFKSFHTNVAGNDPQWQIWPKKWLRLGQNGHFCIFFYLFPQNEAEIDSEWSISPDSQLFPSFATKASHFWRNLKNFHFWGGGVHRQIFEFSNFFKSFHTNVAGNDPQWQIWPKKWLRLGQNGHFCIFFYLFPQNEAEIDSEWSISPDSQLFPSFATKASHFWRNLKNFHFWGGGVHRQIF